MFSSQQLSGSAFRRLLDPRDALRAPASVAAGVRCALLALSVGLGVGVAAAAAEPSEAGANETSKRYIVKMASPRAAASGTFSSRSITTTATTTDGLDAATQASLMQQGRQRVTAGGGHVRLELPTLGALAVELTDKQHAQLSVDPAVQRIEPDPPRYLLAQEVPYGIPLVQSDQVTYGGAPGIKVCVVDSGFDLGHPDLPSGARVTGEAAPGVGNWFEDGTGHGTHVAGSIMALANTEGVIGATNGGDFEVHIYKVFPDEDASVSSSDVIAGVQSCADAGARVVNLSLGCTGNGCFSTTEQEAFAQFAREGILTVAAAGNDGRDAIDGTSPSYPAAYDSVIAVAAVDEFSEHAEFSQQYPEVELAAPGVAVTSTVPRGTGFGSEVSVGLQGFPSNALSFSATGTATGSLVDCGIGDAVCTNVSGQICLIERGTVLFVEKAQNCESGGGIGVIIYNNVPGSFLGTLGESSTVAIPVAGVSDTDGARLVALLGQTSTVTLGPRDYGEKNGTSMATPHVAGVAALVWSRAPEQTNLQIRAALQAGALDLGDPGRDNLFGFGLVQAADAVAQLAGDADSDGLLNTADNCPLDANADQLDTDGDGSGDACDSDIDGDGMSNAYEAEHSLNPLLADALGDQDNDGFSNLSEFYASTSSSDSGSTPQASASPSLVAAVLPTSRSAQVGQPVTAFATLINASTQPGQNCSIAPLDPLPSTFEFFPSNASTNALDGPANTRISLAAGAAQSFIMRLTPNAAIEPLDVRLRFGCDNLGAADVVSGLTTLQLSASESPVADLIALAATASGDGVVRTSAGGAGAFGVASVNIGAAATLQVTPEGTNSGLPLSLSVCETDAQGACLAPAQASISVNVAANATPTFSVFVQVGETTSFDPALNRVRLRFNDASGAIRGATSVAVQRDQ